MKPSSLALALFAATLFLVPALPAKDATPEAESGTSENQAMSKQMQQDILKRFDRFNTFYAAHADLLKF